jgi:hypothetical protein
VEVLLSPYLPLGERRVVGGWELIPRELLALEDVDPELVLEAAHGVAALYRMPGHDRGFGAFIKPPGRRVGDECPDGLRTLYSAVVVSLLDQNPSRAVAGMVDDYNAGHGTCTTENALVFGHRFEPDLYTGFETGTMVVTRHLGPRIGETRDVIEPPADMTLPVMRPRFDQVYAEALHQVLTQPGEDAPDLAGAIRWLELAWTNSASISPEARVLALRAGFDVLFGGARTSQVRSSLSQLLDDPGAPRIERHWDDHSRPQRAHLTDLEWWFQAFALLRSRIAHGGEIAAAEYAFNGAPHIWHGEWQLRRAIKQTVANAGHPDVLLGTWERVEQRIQRVLEEQLPDGNGTNDD